jgi:prepilin-type N-terminal cleavage/methylation domain-containing protein/prepilin-type processing-associated H-X9-DG protein
MGLKVRRQNKMMKSSLGFTLTELLTVIIIITVLAALLMPMAGKLVESANAGKCISNMRQIGVGAAALMAENNGMLPVRLDSLNAQSIESYIYPDTGRPANGGVFHCPSANPNKKSSLGASLGETYAGLSYGRNMGITYSIGSETFPYRISQIKQPSKRALAWESSVWNITTHAANINTRYAPRHRLGPKPNNPLGEAGTFLFIDGHVEMRAMSMNPIDQAEWDELGTWSKTQGSSNITE